MSVKEKEVLYNCHHHRGALLTSSTEAEERITDVLLTKSSILGRVSVLRHCFHTDSHKFMDVRRSAMTTRVKESADCSSIKHTEDNSEGLQPIIVVDWAGWSSSGYPIDIELNLSKYNTVTKVFTHSLPHAGEQEETGFTLF